MNQPLRQLLIDLAAEGDDGDGLREAWDADPYEVGRNDPYNLADHQIRILLRGSVDEIQKEANREAKQIGEPLKRAQVIIDR